MSPPYPSHPPSCSPPSYTPKATSNSHAEPTAPPSPWPSSTLHDAASGSSFSDTHHGLAAPRDLRASSTQSLVSERHSDESRRTLLVIYIHGFYGNDQSFQSFPHHVHYYLREALRETHVIHSKIYPRYKTYRSIEVARDNFSAWLEPHESATTDTILVGHSMGGLLAADIAMMPNQSPYSRKAFKHCIVGTLSLDAPFLGLHPGIIVSGISSLFQPAQKQPEPEPQNSTAPSTTSVSLQVSEQGNLSTASLHSSASNVSSDFPSPLQYQKTDMLFDPPFFNDVRMRERPFQQRVAHFAKKHKAEGIFHALGTHVKSHLEFGSGIANYPQLIERYKKIRALEDVDEVQASNAGHPFGAYTRVRFTNYYTLSTGRPKKLKEGASISSISQLTLSSDVSGNRSLETPHRASADLTIRRSEDGRLTPSNEFLSASPGITPTISVEDVSNQGTSTEEPDGSISTQRKGSNTSLDSRKNAENSTSSLDIHGLSLNNDYFINTTAEQVFTEDGTPNDFSIPPIPMKPTKPTLPELEGCTSNEARQEVEKEIKRLEKTHKANLKTHTKAVRDREKVIEKRQKQKEKDSTRQRKDSAQSTVSSTTASHEQSSTSNVASPGTMMDDVPSTQARGDDNASSSGVKTRQFCTLPMKVDGVLDPTWVDVYMEGVDEVGAHCGIFFLGPHYDGLIGDVGARMVRWVQDDLSTRMILGL